MPRRDLNFRSWLRESEAVYDPKAKGDFNWWGAPGSPGKVIGGNPVRAGRPRGRVARRIKAE